MTRCRYSQRIFLSLSKGSFPDFQSLNGGIVFLTKISVIFIQIGLLIWVKVQTYIFYIQRGHLFLYSKQKNQFLWNFNTIIFKYFFFLVNIKCCQYYIWNGWYTEEHFGCFYWEGRRESLFLNRPNYLILLRWTLGNKFL